MNHSKSGRKFGREKKVRDGLMKSLALALILENKIKTTRNFHAWRQAKEMVADGYRFYGEQKFADYVFVSKDVKVKNFEVPNIEISDHLPLILDFEI